MRQLIVLPFTLLMACSIASTAQPKVQRLLDGDFELRYTAKHMAHARTQDAARFTSDEGNNGVLPEVAPKQGLKIAAAHSTARLR
jgi:hypothetical protein